MEKTEITFESFLLEVDKEYHDFVGKVNQILLDEGHKHKIELKASGYFVSYIHPKTKRSILNFLFRKKGLLIRIYADNCSKYPEFINTIPESMEKEIIKASVCKRLIDPQTCNPKCVTGYDFHIGNNRYQKCRNSSFQFEVNNNSIPILLDFIIHESKERCN